MTEVNIAKYCQVNFHAARLISANNYQGEYTQMSGRAGRRGMDTFGVVIVNTSNSLPQVLQYVYVHL